MSIINIREKQENIEKQLLSKYATFSCNSKGRMKDEPPCDIRTCFQRDRDRILHSKSFRRLKDKTQVFIAPLGDHYRNRLTHTLEVSQIARSISIALNLNEYLVEAIALGHDLGHTPFGHTGEGVLNSLSSTGFVHADQSVRVVEILENDRQGLNLSFEVIDGIKNHRTSGRPSTLEGKVVQLSDKIAYLNHDIDDAIRGGVLKESDIPTKYKEILGYNVKERLDRVIHDIISTSIDTPDVKMSEKIKETMSELRRFMFQHVYINSKAKQEEENAKRMIEALYKLYMDDITLLPDTRRELINNEVDTKERVICDYIAGMTDQFAIREFEKNFIPLSWGE